MTEIEEIINGTIPASTGADLLLSSDDKMTQYLTHISHTPDLFANFIKELMIAKEPLKLTSILKIALVQQKTLNNQNLENLLLITMTQTNDTDLTDALSS